MRLILGFGGIPDIIYFSLPSVFLGIDLARKAALERDGLPSFTNLSASTGSGRLL